MLEDARDFKEWSDDFYDWVEMCDSDIPLLLLAAPPEKEQITALGGTPEVVAKAKPLFRMMKRFIKLKTARQTVSPAPGKNPYEAWRVLFSKFHPKNDATAGAVVIRLCDWKFWKCRNLADVPLTISQWEKLQDDYRQEFQVSPINDLTKREISKNLLPDDVKNFLDTQTMLRDDLTYDQIKSCVNNLAQKVAKVPVPMEISPFNGEDPAGGGDEPLDSFGKGPAGGAKPGKGGGTKGGGTKGGDREKGKETRSCHNGGKKGHLAKDCRQDQKNKNKGKGKGNRERGADGKWYRKSGPGISSWVLDEDQEDGEEAQEENGERSAGAFTALGLGSGLDEEEDGFRGLNMLSAEEEMEEIATDEQKRAMSDFASAYANKVAQTLTTIQSKRVLPSYDMSQDDDEDDDDDEDHEDPMSTDDAWKDYVALSGGTPWRSSGKVGLPDRLMGGQRFMMEQAHSEPSASANVSPSRPGSPMLIRAAKGRGTNQDVRETPLKPNFAEMSANRAVEFDIYSPPSVTDVPVSITTPDVKSPGFNERFGMKTFAPVERSYVSIRDNDAT